MKNLSVFVCISVVCFVRVTQSTKVGHADGYSRLNGRQRAHLLSGKSIGDVYDASKDVVSLSGVEAIATDEMETTTPPATTTMTSPTTTMPLLPTTSPTTTTTISKATPTTTMFLLPTTPPTTTSTTSPTTTMQLLPTTSPTTTTTIRTTTIPFVPTTPPPTTTQRDVRGLRLFDNDFESGTLSPWHDESPANVNWKVEDFASPSEPNSPAPSPLKGTKYARATRNADLLSGLAVLRSDIFTVAPGDKVSFSFWIRSKRPEGNNLELALAVGRDETVLIGLSQFSTSSNFEWRDVTVTIPVSAPTDATLVFYGYCGSNDEDAVAIDNVVVTSNGDTSTTQNTDTTTAHTGTSTTSGTSSEGTTGGPTPTGFPPSCGGSYAEKSGSFASPNYPNDYAENDLQCDYVIEVPGTSSILLTFAAFDTEDGYDFVEVYDGLTFNSPILLSATGNSLPDPVRSSSNQLLVRFTTDSSGANYRGFAATYVAN